MKIGLLTLLLAAVIFLVCSCSPEKKPIQNPDNSKTGGTPMEVIFFSFQHTASNTDDCYYFEVARQENGIRLYAEELFSGGRIADTVIQEPVLEQLSALGAQYRLDRWNGFDKNKKNIRDGSSFTLNMELADGSTISAHGNNAFPENYSDVHSSVRSLYQNLIDRYCVRDGDQTPEDGTATVKKDINAPKSIVSHEINTLTTRFFCLDRDDPAQGTHYAFRISPKDSGQWLLSSETAAEKSLSIDATALRTIQNLIDTYALAANNGLYSVTAGLPVEFSPCSLAVEYASGERLEFTMDGDPEAAWCTAFRDHFLKLLSEGGISLV